VERKERIDHYKDGSVKARGSMREGQLDGYWEWFRKDGTKMRAGHFAMGKQTGVVDHL
jgi:antitoxin component YwqK of YwqJK toxin-antitoxin module